MELPISTTFNFIGVKFKAAVGDIVVYNSDDTLETGNC
jgi:hypothetical protein